MKRDRLADLELTWALDDTVTRTDVLAALAADFSVEAGAVTSAANTFVDNADGDLWHAGVLLAQAGEQYCLTMPDDASAVLRGPAGARFWWDFPDGALRDVLRQLIGVRALMPAAALHLEQTELALRNGDQKLVVKGSVTESSVKGRTVRYLTLRALRGYADAFAQACQCSAPLAAGCISDLSTRAMLARHPVPAFAPRARLVMPITNNMATERAVRTMAGVMLEQAQHHVGGVVQDIDSEYLHEFRVGLRKTRSLLSLLKKALPEQAHAQLKPRLARISGATNTLRDLDVFLLAQQDYRAMLPANLHAGMDELATLVRQQRAKEQSRVARYLSSSGYMADMDACVAELAAPALLATPMAAKPVLRLVKRQLRKRYAALLTMSRAIDQQSADDAVHALRIEMKKLRYLIEFFLDLLPRSRSLKLLGEMKKLQTILGEFNDYSVQVDFLGAYVDDRQLGMAKALSGLIAILHLKQSEKRAQVVDALAGFFSDTMTIKFNLVFDGGEPRDAQ